MRKIGLALGSGGARGYAHIGVIKILQKNNIPIDFIAGTSIGAIVGGYFALNLNTDKLEEIGLDLNAVDIWKKLVDLNNPKKSLIKGQKIRDFLKQFFGDKTFKDTKIPLAIGATDIEDGKLVVFKKGKIIDAAIASSTLPGIFPAYAYENKHLVDGGIADGLPIDLVRKMGADIIIGVDLYNSELPEFKDTSTLSVMERTYNILLSKLSIYQEHEYKNNIIVLRPKTGSGIQLFAFDKAKKFIEAGEKEAEKNLEKIKRMINKK
jgi:NTE family protein